MTSLCTSQRRRMYVSNETPNDVSVEHRQDFSVVRLHDILLECCDEVSRGRNNNIPSVHVLDVSNKSQMKHQQRLSESSARRLSGTYPWRPISTSLRRLL